MIKYSIKYDKKYLKDLEVIPDKFRASIQEKVTFLVDNPRPEGSIKLKGSKKEPLYRIRCGDYRIVYAVYDKYLVVLLVEVGHRREIYR